MRSGGMAAIGVISAANLAGSALGRGSAQWQDLLGAGDSQHPSLYISFIARGCVPAQSHCVG